MPHLLTLYHIKRLGFNSEAILRSSLDEAEFCSCRLYRVCDKWVFGPMPGKVLSKFGFINSPPVNVTRESMIKGIAIGMLRSCIFIPPIMSVVKRVLELTEHVDAYTGYATRFKDDFWNMHFDYSSFDNQFNPDVFASLFVTYGWTVNMQDGLDRELQTMQLDSVVTQNSYLNVLFDRDTAGPAVMAA
jgi:hypothetical protein